uniref:Immunoglobulin domain-containing protein n=1 Tax=Pygocentrus nattereri TaxID=42514 RepID=A0A3B4EJK7_PYGNA
RGFWNVPVWNYAKSVSVTGHVGGSVNISCKYPQSQRSHPRFLCRMMGNGDCNYETSVKESRRWRNEGKLSLHDDRAKQIFTVSFNHLTEGDSGEYWCGAESDWTSDHGYKVFINQINLTVTGE